MTENSPKQPKSPATPQKPATSKAATTKKVTVSKAVTAKKPAASKSATAAKPVAAIVPVAPAPAPAVIAPSPAPVAVVAPPATSYTPPPAPQPAPVPVPMLEKDARMWAMLLHILAAVAIVASAGTLAFLVPLVLWLMYRDRSALIDHHGKQNLNLQLTSILVIVIGTIIGLITLGFGFLLTGPLMLGYGIYAVVISIVAGVKANSGEYYSIPAAIRFIR